MALRWGVVGPGGIARGVIADLAHVGGCELVATGSRSKDRAQAFADDFGGRAHGSYRELLDDADVDVVYIATPHRQHHAIALAAIEAGKHLLVEKAFTCTLDGTREVVDAARARGVFVMEAMWTRFVPLVVRLRELVDDGAIGEVRSVSADLGLVREVDPSHRLFDRARGGGALLDLGVYPVSWAQMLLGRPERVHTHGHVGPTGVETDAALLLASAGGIRAFADCSLTTALPGAARVVGTTGRIDVEPRFHHPTAMWLHRKGAEPERIEAGVVGSGYAHELVEVRDCVASGRSESAAMPLDATVAVMQTLTTALDALGIEFDEDPDALA